MLAKVLRRSNRESGFTLFELIVTLSILGVLVMGTIPLAQNAVKREKEMKLRETLRMVRAAIDEFKRDTRGACTVLPTANTSSQVDQRGRTFGITPLDPTSRVMIDDCTVFTVDNMDRYPPTLETLVDGIAVRDRGVGRFTGGSGLINGSPQATELAEEEEVLKVYLRRMPVDPMTGQSDWILRSSYQEPDDPDWDGINVFDIRSASDGTALDGTKYSDW